jgi:hypothetical protein
MASKNLTEIKLVCKESFILYYDVHVYLFEGEVYHWRAISNTYYASRLNGSERWMAKNEIFQYFYTEAESLSIIRKRKLKYIFDL